MKLAYDITLMRPACVLVAAGMGADTEASSAFDPSAWLLIPTPNMKVYETTPEQLRRLVADLAA